MDVETLIDKAIGLPYEGRVNFYILNALLKCFATKLQMSKDDISLYLRAETILDIRNRLRGGADEGIEPQPPNARGNVEPKQTETVSEGRPNFQSAEITYTEANSEAPASQSSVYEALKETETSFDDLLFENGELESSSSFFAGEIDEEESNLSQYTLHHYMHDIDMDFQLSSLNLSVGSGGKSNAQKPSISLWNYVKKKDFIKLKRRLDVKKIKAVTDNYDFILHSILTLIKVTIGKKWDPHDIRRLLYLQSKLSNGVVNLNSSEIEIPLPTKTKKKKDLVVDTSNAFSNENYITRHELVNHKVIEKIKYDMQLMFLKVDALTTRFLKRNFEKEYELLHKVAEKGREFIDQFGAVEAKVSENTYRLETLEKICRECQEECTRMEKEKLDSNEFTDVLSVKPDFTHLNKKVSIVDFIQHKYELGETIFLIGKTLDDFEEKIDIFEDVHQLLKEIEKADWMDVLREEFTEDIKKLRKEILGVIKSKEESNNFGIPLMWNFPHSLSKKEQKCEQPQNNYYYTPSLGEIRKSCLKNLSKPEDFLYRGTTRPRQAPSKLNHFELCGKKVETILKR